MKAMRAFFRRLRRSEKGQGMTEYIIIVALIAVASITMITLFGDTIRGLFATAGQALSGESTSTSEHVNPEWETGKTRGMDDFGTLP